jgi:hypothetical protein
MSDLDEFYVHTLTVETYQGENSLGPVYATGVPVPGFLDTTSDLQRSSSGDAATSAGSMFYCHPTYAGLFTVQSRVNSADLGGDGKAVVVKLNNLTSGPLGLPDHVEVGLL